MSVHSGPRIVTDGLILNLDVSNRRSYMRSIETSSINTTLWAVGQTDGIYPYYGNGSTGENARVLDTDPWGNSSTVWETRASGNDQADGGWNTEFFTIDKTKLYRFSVWVKRTSSTSGGTFYLGTNSNGGVFATYDSLEKGNPYWECVSTSTLTQNQWYLVCGFVYPYNTTYTGNHPASGYYLPGSTTKVRNLSYCNIGSDLKWGSTSTTAQHRCYHYYCADATTRLQFADPRVDVCDGNEPSIYELVTNGATMIMDTSLYNNHHKIYNGYIPSAASPKRFQLDGTNHGLVRTSALNGASTANTVVLWYSTTDTQELWVRGNQNNGTYLSASASNNYYHSSCGSPTNYVDLNVVVRPDTPVNYRNGAYHMWEAKNVDFSTWTYFDWFLYPGGWQMLGNLSTILVYNRALTAAESATNYAAFRGRFGL